MRDDKGRFLGLNKHDKWKGGISLDKKNYYKEYDKSRKGNLDRREYKKIKQSERRKDPAFREKEKMQRIKIMSTDREKQRRAAYKKTEKGKIVNEKYKKSEKGRFSMLKCHLKRLYNMSIEEYNSMVKKQNGICDLCHKNLIGKIVIDHDHKTGKVRGIIHQKCNILIGIANDSIRNLEMASEYLIKHNVGNESKKENNKRTGQVHNL